MKSSMKMAAALSITVVILAAVFVLAACGSTIEKGTFLVLSLTLAALIIYTYSTHQMAIATAKKFALDAAIKASYEIETVPEIIDGKRDVKMFIRLSNHTDRFIFVKIWCNFRVNDQPVLVRDDVDGQSVWTVFPGQMSQGWLRINEVLTQAGKNVDQLIQEHSSENRTKQLTMDLTLEFRDESDQRKVWPSRRHYFDAPIHQWIPVLTTVGDWNDAKARLEQG